MREVLVTCPECSELVKVDEVDERVMGLTSVLRDPDELLKVQLRVGTECRYHDEWKH